MIKEYQRFMIKEYQRFMIKEYQPFIMAKEHQLTKTGQNFQPEV